MTVGLSSQSIRGSAPAARSFALFPANEHISNALSITFKQSSIVILAIIFHPYLILTLYQNKLFKQSAYLVI